MTTGVATGEIGGLASDGDPQAKRNSHHESQTNQLRALGFRMSDAEVEAILESCQNENYSEKTWTRLLVENYLQYVSDCVIRKCPVSSVALIAALIFCVCVCVCVGGGLWIPLVILPSSNGTTHERTCQVRHPWQKRGPSMRWVIHINLIAKN
jgi:hypothetical protein